MFPRENLSREAYQSKSKNEETAVNHLFEKLLRLRGLMYTESGKREAEIRQRTMTAFLEAFFRERELDGWLDYLRRFA